MPIQLQRILCATDLSYDSDQVLPYGIALARAFEARLLVGHCVDLTPAGIAELTPRLGQSRIQELRQAAEEKMRRLIAEPSVPWEALVLSGTPAAALSEAAEEHGVDLVITATRPRPVLRRLILGSVTESLVHSVECPLLAIRSPQRDFLAPEAESVFLRRILVGCDFSSDSAAALDYAVSLAQKFESELCLIHSLEPTLYKHLNGATGALAQDIEGAVANTVKHKLSALVPGEKNPWCKVKTVFASGAPHAEILNYAGHEDVDLIVLGKRGQGLLEKIFIGSTVDRVLRQARCPVLVVQAGNKGGR